MTTVDERPTPVQNAGRFTVAEMAGLVTLTVALARKPDTGDLRYLQYEVTAGKFHAVLPHCGCDCKPCTGPGVWGRVCAESQRKGAAGYTHNRDHCHGTPGGWHEEHVLVYAREVLARFGPKRKHKLPEVRRSTYPRNWSIYKPLVGEHPRLALDQWIAEHATVTAAEPDQAELEAALRVAQAERSAVPA